MTFNPIGGNKMLNKTTGFCKSGRLDVIELDGDKYFSSYEVVRRLGICSGTFYSMKRKFNLQGVMVGKKKYYNEKELSKIIFHRTMERGK